MNPALAESVRAFVAQASPIPAGRISSASSLEDLGIDDPDHAAYFLVEFGRVFAVDMTGLDVSRHIGQVWTDWSWLFFILASPPAGLGYAVGMPVPLALALPPLLWWLGHRLEKRLRGRHPSVIKVQDLICAAETRTWQGRGCR